MGTLKVFIGIAAPAATAAAANDDANYTWYRMTCNDHTRDDTTGFCHLEAKKCE